MNPQVTIEVDARHEALLRRTLAWAEEMEQLALTAPEGTVFDACENAVIERGRALQAQLLSEAVTRRIEAVEKKGRRCGCASAGAGRKTGGRNHAAS